MLCIFTSIFFSIKFWFLHCISFIGEGEGAIIEWYDYVIIYMLDSMICISNKFFNLHFKINEVK